MSKKKAKAVKKKLPAAPPEVPLPRASRIKIKDVKKVPAAPPEVPVAKTVVELEAEFEGDVEVPFAGNLPVEVVVPIQEALRASSEHENPVIAWLKSLW
jgi:hypothetical protein